MSPDGRWHATSRSCSRRCPPCCRAAAHTDRLIDLHFHALPGVDDGPADEAAAVALARAAADAGTDTIVATPHRSRRWPTEPERIAAGVARMGELERRGGLPVRLPP